MSEADRQRWDERYRDGPRLREPSSFVQRALASLPPRGRALDLAGGTGRHAIALARHGLEVTLVDVSPVGLAHAAREAEAAGVTIRCEALDLERVDKGELPFPAGPWLVVLGHHYLWRRLPELATPQLAPGGFLLYCQPTARNLERHARPPERFLLREGELAEVAAVPGLEVVSLEESWLDGRHEARLVARRLNPSGPGG